MQSRVSLFAVAFVCGLACAACSATDDQAGQISPAGSDANAASGAAPTAGASADGPTSCADDPACATAPGCKPPDAPPPASAPGEPPPQDLPTCWDGRSAIECAPACAPAQQCVLQVAPCDEEPCPLFPNCIDAPSDPCATVMCPGICAVDSEGKCVAVLHPDPLATGTPVTAGSDPASLPHVFADAATLNCPSLAERYYKTLDVLFNDRRSCMTDADCTRVSSGVTCASSTGEGDQLRFTDCGAAIARSARDDFETARASLEAMLCAIDPLPGCRASSLCGVDPAARCVDGNCAIR